MTGCCRGDGRLVADVAPCVVEDRLRWNARRGELSGAANLAATSPTDLTDFSQVPADQPMLGVDAAAPADRRLSAGLGR